MKKVLILGNGVSRVHHKEFIQNWKDEIWGCNSAFKEFHKGDLHRLDVIMGDYKALLEIIEFQKKNKTPYKLYGKHLKAKQLQGVELVPVEKKFINDSGSTLVALALTKGYDRIVCVGFDLGGPDIYVKGHANRNKEKWVRNWRLIAGKWGLDKIKFIGYDHKPFILSNQPSETYAQLYMNGLNHIEYLSINGLEPIVKKTKVMILGNGKSRLDKVVQKEIESWNGEIWVCNHAYKEALKLPTLDRVGTVHDDVAIDAIKFREENKLNYDVYINQPIKDEKYKNQVKFFKEKRGWSTGNLMIAQAHIDGYREIVLAGYDFGGPDIYQKTDRPGNGFSHQFKFIKKKWGLDRMRFLGNQPVEIV